MLESLFFWFSTNKFVSQVLKILYFENNEIKLKIIAISSDFFIVFWMESSKIWGLWDQILVYFSLFNYHNIWTNKLIPMTWYSNESYTSLVSNKDMFWKYFGRCWAERPNLCGQSRPKMALHEKVTKKSGKTKKKIISADLEANVHSF